MSTAHIRTPAADVDVPWCEEETPSARLTGEDLERAVEHFLPRTHELDWIEWSDSTSMCPVCLALALEASQGRR